MRQGIIIIVILSLFSISCASTQNNDDSQTGLSTDHIDLGWANEDTYTVKVIGKNETNAIANAKHKILKDIVNVRVLNESPYTDITKIQREFEKPLSKGKIINKSQISGGIEIIYQIQDKGLKKKFERK